MIPLITILCIAGLIAYYLKFKHDEKKKAGRKKEVREVDITDIDELINDFPTYSRNKKLKI